MIKKINLWSFILSMVCFLLFFVFSSVLYLKEMIIIWTGIHPLILILYITLIVFLLGVIGIFGVSNGKTAIRSLITILLSLGLSIILAFIIFFGKLLNAGHN